MFRDQNKAKPVRNYTAIMENYVDRRLKESMVYNPIRTYYLEEILFDEEFLPESVDELKLLTEAIANTNVTKIRDSRTLFSKYLSSIQPESAVDLRAIVTPERYFVASLFSYLHRNERILELNKFNHQSTAYNLALLTNDFVSYFLRPMESSLHNFRLAFENISADNLVTGIVKFGAALIGGLAAIVKSPYNLFAFIANTFLIHDSLTNYFLKRELAQAEENIIDLASRAPTFEAMLATCQTLLPKNQELTLEILIKKLKNIETSCNDANFILGKLYQESNNMDKAVFYYKNLNKRHPRFIDAMFECCNDAFIKKDYQKAKEYLDQTMPLAIQKNHPMVKDLNQLELMINTALAQRRFTLTDLYAMHAKDVINSGGQPSTSEEKARRNNLFFFNQGAKSLKGLPSPHNAYDQLLERNRIGSFGSRQ